jgi:hypothetical protein
MKRLRADLGRRLKAAPQSNLEITLKAGHYKNQELMVIWFT